MQEEITNGFLAVVKFTAYYIIWSFVLFNLGHAREDGFAAAQLQRW